MRLSPVGLVATLALAILVAPRAAHAQPPGKVFRVGVLLPADVAPSTVFRVFTQRLQELGYVEGQNLALDSHPAPSWRRSTYFSRSIFSTYTIPSSGMV